MRPHLIPVLALLVPACTGDDLPSTPGGTSTGTAAGTDTGTATTAAGTDDATDATDDTSPSTTGDTSAVTGGTDTGTDTTPPTDTGPMGCSGDGDCTDGSAPLGRVSAPARRMS